MKRTSLARRATATVLAIETLCAAVFTLTALWHENSVRMKALDQALVGRTDSLVGAIQDAEDPLDQVKVDPEEFSAPPGDQFAVYTPEGKLIGASPGDNSAVALQAANGLHSISIGSARFRVLQRSALRIVDRDETPGGGIRRPVTIVYATVSNRVWHEVLEATQFYVLLSVALVGLSGLALVLFTRKLLAPIQDLSLAASGIGPESLSFAAPQSALQIHELQPLAEALSSAIQRLRRAFEMERAFMSDAAHELKTAIAVVRSSIQVIAVRERTIAEYRAGLDDVLRDNERVEALVAQMLLSARFDEEASAVAPLTDLGDEVTQAVGSISPYADLRGILVNVETAHGRRVRLSPDALRSLTTNLVVNALQHSPAGSQVCVRVKPGAASGECTLEVQDSGSGIHPGVLPHVFERFFRADPSRSRETGGAGLGLSICKSIVERAGGTITIKSTLGSGTCVTVRLPSGHTT